MSFNTLDFQIGHGPSKFVKNEKVASLKRQETEGGQQGREARSRY